MRIAVASDIHGSLPCAYAFFERAKALGAEKILLLGDLYYHGVRNPLPEGYNPSEVVALLNDHREELIVVRGNCDSDVDCCVSKFDLVESAVLSLGGKGAFLTHGDRYDIDHLPAGKYDLLLYGHFHTGFIREKEGMIVANPGSLSLPKGGTVRSFLLLTEEEIALYSLEGEKLESRML